MDNENNVHLANDGLDETQQNSISDAKKCIEVKYKKDDVKSNLVKHAMIWTPRAISTLLKIYEAKLLMLKSPKKKTRIWIVISKCLNRCNIQVTPEQVKWVVKALTKRYKRCLNGEQPERFKYFKEMNKIYAKFNVSQDDNTIAKVTRREQSIYNNRLGSKTDHKTCKTFQESNAAIQLRKSRLANRIESDQSQSKIRLEEQWLQYIKKQEDQKLSRAENFEKNLQVREEELELRKKTFKIHESFEYRKMQMWERKHETLLRIEREKFEMLKKMSSLP